MLAGKARDAQGLGDCRGAMGELEDSSAERMSQLQDKNSRSTLRRGRTRDTSSPREAMPSGTTPLAPSMLRTSTAELALPSPPHLRSSPCLSLSVISHVCSLTCCLSHTLAQKHTHSRSWLQDTVEGLAQSKCSIDVCLRLSGRTGQWTHSCCYWESSSLPPGEKVQFR